MYLHIHVNLQIKGECFLAHPRTVQGAAKRNTAVCFTSWTGQKGNLSLDPECFSLSSSGGAVWLAHLALFRHSGYSNFEVRLFTQCRKARPTRRSITRSPCTVSSSCMSSLARLHLAHRPYLLAAFLANPLVGRAVR